MIARVPIDNIHDSPFIDSSELAGRLAWTWLLALIFALDAARLLLRLSGEEVA